MALAKLTRKIVLPPCMTPRPGEKVVLFQGETKYDGVFHGYNTADQLLVKHRGDGILIAQSFEQVRPADPTRRTKGCLAKLPKNAVVQDASEDEVASFESLLSQHLAPGPTYYDFFYEIWARGYEAYLVGGSVRDVINGDLPNDVDLVTTIPFSHLEKLVTAMFGQKGFSRHHKNGFMSVGKGAGARPRGSDPLMDVKNIFSFSPGTDLAEFGADLDIDKKLRDFSCNAVYYDPINKIYVDPCGHGISDAKGKVLNIVNDAKLEHPTYRKANISLRFFKFTAKGYKPTEECVSLLQSVYLPLIHTMGAAFARTSFKRFLLSKVQETDRPAAMVEYRDQMYKYGFGEIFEKYFAGIENELVSGSAK